MKKVVCMSFISLMLIACGSETSIENNTSELPDSTGSKLPRYASDKPGDFNERFKALLLAIKKNEKEELSKFISPEYGLLIVNATGALPHFVFSREGKRDYEKAMEWITENVPDPCELTNAPLPKIDCDSKTFYSKTGCFVRDTNALKESEIWKFGNLDEGQEKLAAAAIKNIGRTVIITGSMTFFFTYHNNDWFLALVDLRKPCQA
jgi:hypothetical protein